MEKQQNNLERKFVSLPDALRKVAQELRDGTFEQKLREPRDASSHVTNLDNKQKDWLDSFEMPATLEDYQKEVEHRSRVSDASSTLGNQVEGQPEDMTTLEVRFVPNPKQKKSS